jgi:hypothetical protein
LLLLLEAGVLTVWCVFFLDMEAKAILDIETKTAWLVCCIFTVFRRGLPVWATVWPLWKWVTVQLCGRYWAVSLPFCLSFPLFLLPFPFPLFLLPRLMGVRCFGCYLCRMLDVLLHDNTMLDAW